jgi:ATP-dependent Clp protease ATP-binding subunit ClpC
MYQHLTETAKDVLKLAEKFARSDDQEYVGTEHVLQAILGHGLGIGAQILQNYSITLPAVQDRIRQLTRQSREETWVLGRLPGTPHFRQVISLAIEEAENLKDMKVGTEYLLLGLLRESDCVAERVLRDLGLTLELARKEIACLQGRPCPAGSSCYSKPVNKPKPSR